MKNLPEKKYNIIATYALAVIGISILMVTAVFNIDKIFAAISKIISVIMPIIWGLAIAYLLNPIMVFTEKKINRYIFRKNPHKKAARRISVALTTIIILLVVAFLISIVVPEVSSSIKSIVNSAPDTAKNIQNWINNTIDNNEYLKNFFNEQVNFVNNIDKYIADWQPILQNIGAKSLDMVTSIAHNVWNFVLGIIVSVYLLLSKETLISQIKKIFFAFFSKKTCEKALSFYHSSNGKFIGFINGKIIDSLIIGMICFASLTMLNFQKNVILISVIICITNIIPFFGPFIGAIPSGILVLIAEPKKTLVFVIFIIILQQFDGNILGPRILGETTGLPAFWVLFSIFLGGGLFGFIGMVLSVPTFAIIYGLIKGIVEAKLEEKHLPKDSSAYEGSVTHLYTVKRAKDMTDEEKVYEEYVTGLRTKKPGEEVSVPLAPTTEISDEPKPEFIKPKGNKKK